MPDQVYKIGTRASRLALAQTGQVAAQLARLNPNVHFETVTITTEGDADRRTALENLGGQGLFTKRIEQALLDHEIDIAVHSAKDLPSVMTEGLLLAAVPERESACDAWLGSSGTKLADVRPGAVVGTGSPRRRAQLLNHRPDLKVEGIRGNVDTRLRKLSEVKYDAIIMAHAGLIRAGLADQITELLDPEAFIPAPGQGALAIQTRIDDDASIKLAQTLDHTDSHRAADIERKLLELLGAGCSTPVGGYARLDEDRWYLTAVVLDNRGKTRLCVNHDIALTEDNDALLGHVVNSLLKQGARELIAGDK